MSEIDRAVVTKYQLYPPVDPTGYAVGFTVELTAGYDIYIDTLVSLADATQLSTRNIVELAWTRVRDQAIQKATQVAEENVIGLIVEERNPPPTYQAWDAEVAAVGTYDTGAIVTHRDENWISIKDDNKAEPGVKDWERYEEPVAEPEPTPEHPAWDPTLTYSTGDIVTHNGDTWVSSKDANKEEPGVKDWSLYTGA